MADAVETDLPSVQLRRESTAEQVAGVLRGLIVAGTIGPGTHLSEGPMSQQLGVSRNTVREALEILVSEGLVSRRIHRGAYVTQLDADDVRDLFRVRRLIEVAAVREAARARLDVSALEPQLALMAAATSRADLLGAELVFWQSLVGLVHSERFGALHASATSELQLSIAHARQDPADGRAVVRQLRAILAAIRKGDPDRGAAAVAERLDGDEAEHLARLPD